MPQVAIARSKWLLEHQVDPDGGPLPPRNDILVNVLEFQDGCWLIIDAQNTDMVEGVLSRPNSVGLEIRRTVGTMTPNDGLQRAAFAAAEAECCADEEGGFD